MYESAGHSPTPEWRERALADIPRRLGVDLWGWVIDADEPDTLAACALIDRHPRLAPPGEDASWRGYVQWVSTDPRYQRRGHATALMTTLAAWAEEQGVKALELNATPEGQPVYERLGWAVHTGTTMRVRLGGPKP